MGFYKELAKGLWKENPIFRLVLGMCPALAVTTSVENSLGMGVAATFVLVCSNVVISIFRNLIPAKVRIPCFIVVIATFVTIVDLPVCLLMHMDYFRIRNISDPVSILFHPAAPGQILKPG